jgi:hypothetical protein
MKSEPFEEKALPFPSMEDSFFNTRIAGNSNAHWIWTGMRPEKIRRWKIFSGTIQRAEKIVFFVTIDKRFE